MPGAAISAIHRARSPAVPLRTFSPEDEPARLAELIAGFLRAPALAHVLPHLGAATGYAGTHR
jgi:hypothetical protein